MKNIKYNENELGFNHSLDNTLEACGIDRESFEEKRENMAKEIYKLIEDLDNFSNSMLVEIAENTFSIRELAFMHSMDLSNKLHSGIEEEIGSIIEEIIEPIDTTKH